GRRPAHQFPPSAHDAARPRDGLLRRRGDEGAVQPRGPRAVSLLLVRGCNADPVRPRSANEWRSFWHHGGEQELADLLGRVWPPAAARDEARPAATGRVALPLGSSAPLRALAAELGRIRGDLGAVANPAEDGQAAEVVQDWFESQRAAGGVSCGS